MSEVLLALTAFVAALLSLFSGFGLGTILLPAFAFFLPLDLAVASTAVVHGANSLFKTILLRKDIDSAIILRFGIPAIVAAAVGASVLGILAVQDPLYTWHPWNRAAVVTPLRLVMAVLIFSFALLEFIPSRSIGRIPPRYLPLGGAVSGFFGGLSGHQGALRAAFLSPLGLQPASFAATQALLGLLVDLSRLVVYGMTIVASSATLDGAGLPGTLVIVAVAAAFTGSLLGKRLLPTMTVSSVRKITGILLILVSLALGLGIV